MAERRIAKPPWNQCFETSSRHRGRPARDRGSLRLPADARSLSEYFATWLSATRGPREPTPPTGTASAGSSTWRSRASLGQWPLAALRRRHALALVDHLLRVQGVGSRADRRDPARALGDGRGRDHDEAAERNPFKGVPVRASDPRALMRQRPVRVFSLGAMHRFARAADAHEAMVRVFTDAGLRLGEVLPYAARTSTDAHFGCGVTPAGWSCAAGAHRENRVRGSRRGASSRRLPASSGASRASIAASGGRGARPAASTSAPNECRHSYITHRRRAGVDDAASPESLATGSRQCSPSTHTRSVAASRTSAAQSANSNALDA
jgi:hypothetical protein